MAVWGCHLGLLAHGFRNPRQPASRIVAQQAVAGTEAGQLLFTDYDTINLSYIYQTVFPEFVRVTMGKQVALEL